MNYNQAYELWQENKNLNWTPELIQDIQDEYEKAVLSLYKNLFGKKTKDWTKAFSKLKENFEKELAETIKPYQNEVSKRYNDIKIQKESNEEKIKLFAKGFVPNKQAEKYLLKTSESYSYHTQGWGANKYARQALNDSIKLLEIMGFDVEIKVVNQHNTGGQYSSYHEDYQLWANITEFDYYLFNMSGKFISTLNWAFLCWENGTNPKVYFPFLSDDDYQKSQVMSYNTNFEITAENMGLEMSWEEINLIRRK